MAIYHCSIKIISRGKGRSAVAAAAYRAGEKIINEYDGRVSDYTKKGGIVYKEILLPDNAPEEYSDRAVLWNAVEKIEKAANSQLAREIEIALPVELSREQNISLVREYVKNSFVNLGMCADVCVHDKKDGNPHAHIMLTMRPFNADKTWGIKERKDYAFDENGNRIPVIDETTGLQKLDGRNRKQWKRVYVQANDWNDQAKAEEWREAWAESVNAILEKHGHAERIDHRSYERQGIEQIPTVHMGVAATQMERRGIQTERGNMNRIIAGINRRLRQLWEQIKALKDWLKDAVAPAVTPAAPPTLASVLQGVLESEGQDSRYGKIRNLDMAVRVLSFMKENGISKMSELQDKVQETVDKYSATRDNLKYYDGRIKTLETHITQGAVYMKHKEIYAEYKSLKPRKQQKFYDAHSSAIILFESAQRYFKERHIKPGFSVNDWKKERADLINGRGKVYREYTALKGQFDNAYTIKREAEQIVRELNAPQQQRKPQSRGWTR